MSISLADADSSIVGEKERHNRQPLPTTAPPERSARARTVAYPRSRVDACVYLIFSAYQVQEWSL